MTGIRNIIFDLGGVILDLSYEKTVEAFHALGFPAFDQEFVQSLQSVFFQDFEKGNRSEEEFYRYISEKSSLPLSTQDIDTAWNAMLIRIPMRRLQLLQQLNIHYHTFLLSNTNAVHEKAFNRMLKSVCGFENFSVFFDKIYLSHRLGMRKPDAEIFERILADNQILPQDTLFIDDSIQHIETARKIGLQTIHLLHGMTIEKDVFRSAGTGNNQI